MPLNDEQWRALARDFRRAVARVAPEWTDSGTHDPGVTVLELLAYALADLRYREGASSPDARALARDVARRAAALALAFGDDSGGGLRRVDYFAGMLLAVDDFRVEQNYLLDRLNRRNRLLHGVGIVAGLQVTVQADTVGPRVVIAPGLAFDTDGREIFVDAPYHLMLPAPGAALLVQVAYREHPCRSVVSVASGPLDPTDAPTETTRPSRIVETFDATLAPVAAANAVTIARVRSVRGHWRVDPKFEAHRVR